MVTSTNCTRYKWSKLDIPCIYTAYVRFILNPKRSDIRLLVPKDFTPRSRREHSPAASVSHPNESYSLNDRISLPREIIAILHHENIARQCSKLKTKLKVLPNYSMKFLFRASAGFFCLFFSLSSFLLRFSSASFAAFISLVHTIKRASSTESTPPF